MKFNLIDEQWIPVKRRDGTEARIAPWEVTTGINENPVVALNAPRPDFNGALIQFLIGLVQTTAAPANPIEWKEKLSTPPSPDELKAYFSAVRYAFELGGDGPKFMQDFNELGEKENTKNIDKLLIDTPGEKTCADNTDHFVKRNRIKGICPSCCANALFAMQTNAPSGGQGNRTSLRGGGPLTTIVIGHNRFNTIWHTIWLNVLESASFLNMCNNKKNADSDKFPWLAATKLQATQQEIHPTQYFWAMPRRIRLNLEILTTGRCEICSKESDSLISSYREVNKGTEYKAPMKHPLSAFNGKTQKALLTQAGGISYRHWLGFVMNDADGNREPARIVHKYINERHQSEWQFRLWAFGYDMDNMKARCWYDTRMPLILVEGPIIEEYEQCVASMIQAASLIANNLRTAVKKAWFKRSSEIKGDTTFIYSTFWHNTESAFYESISAVKLALESGNVSTQNLMTWHKSLCNEALKLFDSYAWNGPIEDADPKRTVIARKELQSYNHGKKIKELLGLPVEKKIAPKKEK